eukprot:CAMPEP_0115556020 /NCGR_PEP_ID=MMETSP0271-20121206/98133_1 /TAXON_ID=71861 /ORGANISM="Scrippsiella trochoidea, Strain CCMP3099" /LENGTH=95 /DNA_ID=CAMNT_0002989843 /DNA_START=9 /DNA_END=294 /DNA_ORIENTATION=-
MPWGAIEVRDTANAAVVFSDASIQLDADPFTFCELCNPQEADHTKFQCALCIEQYPLADPMARPGLAARGNVGGPSEATWTGAQLGWTWRKLRCE